ncbi:MAG: hypothetical protein LBJ88_05035 [Campylobacteraceae bacterium]|jgi:hypothetical protein|nr:hypothetical protein [Campylobacteraceae bacterium]
MRDANLLNTLHVGTFSINNILLHVRDFDIYNALHVRGLNTCNFFLHVR